MFTSIFHAGTFSVINITLTFAVSLVCGLLIAIIYKRCNVATGKYAIVLAIVPTIVAAIILIINGNLGASVAVLGAFGLVRFRSATGTAAEIGYLFYAMAAGLSAGMGFLTLTLVLTVVVGIAITALEFLGFAQPVVQDRVLKITIPEHLNYHGLFDELFKSYTRYTHLETVRTTGMGTLYELQYRLRLKSPDKEKEFIDDLRCLNGNLDVCFAIPGTQGGRATSL
ncbi:MAG: DUF4956 domain-containing protein [Butyrivibrio sp.]|nr:DUF4956 domain-containing protein [Butyrivibrio sp.]